MGTARDDQTTLWVLTGPTASGKTGVALDLAERLDAEILSVDSMAVYRGMDIGTAKPSPNERARVRHHLIDVVEPHESFDTARWCELAAAAVDDVRARGRRPLLVGGTPLYLLAFLKGMLDGPAADPELRAALHAREAERPGSLHEELRARDPDAAAKIHRNDAKRLVRALEVLETTGRPISAQQQHFDQDAWRRPCRIAAIRRDRDDLHERVRLRTREMLAAGLVDETRAIRDDRGFSSQAAAAIGYAECLDWLAGRYKDEEELRNRIRRSTHRLIRRQTTWLRRLTEITWIEPDAQAADAVLGAWTSSS